MQQLKSTNMRIWGKWTAVVLLTANLTLAQTWTGNGADGDWSDTANWEGGALPVLPATLTFDGNRQLNTNNNWAASATVSGLTFAATAGDFTLSGNALTLATSGTVAVLGATSQTIGLDFNLLNYGVEFNVAAGGTLTVSGNISGGNDNSPYNNALNSRALTVSGGGDVLLSGSNSYHGSVNVSGGRLILGGDHVLGAFSANNQNVGNGYSLVLDSGTVEMNGHHAMLYGYTGSVGTLIVNSAGGDAVTLTFAGGNSLYGLANTNFSGNLRLVFSATFLGTSVMSIANDYTGGTVFQDNAGADVALISVSGSYVAPNNALRVINALALGSGTVEFAGNGYMGSNNSGASGWDNWLNDIKVTGTNNWLAFFNNTNSKGSWHGDGTINIHNGFSPTFTFSGNLHDFTGRLNLISAGNDAFAVVGAAAGSLVNASVSLVLADNTGTSNRYVYLQATDANPTVQIGDLSTLSAPGGGAELGAYGAAVVRHTTAGLATFQVGALGLSSTFAGIVSDNGAITVVDGTLTFADSHGNNKSALAKVGAGTWTLTNQNTYTGTTTVSGGVLLLSGTGSINGSARVAVSGGELAVNSSVVLTPMVSVGAGGALTGSGTLGGTVEFDDATGTVSGGGLGTVGTLTFTDAQYWDDFTYLWDIIGTGQYDTLDITHTNGLQLIGDHYTLTVNNPNAVAIDNLVIISGVIKDFDADNWQLGEGFSLSYKNNELLLSYAIPEPSTWLLLGTGVALLAVLRRRR